MPFVPDELVSGVGDWRQDDVGVYVLDPWDGIHDAYGTHTGYAFVPLRS